MLHTLWSVKGGSGVTVTAAALGATLARRDGAAVVVDLCGDQPAALGLAEPSGPGLREWLATPDGSADALRRLLVPVDESLSLLPAGVDGAWSPGRLDELVAALASWGDHVVVDAGTLPEAPDAGPADRVRRHGELGAHLRAAGSSFLVIRPCYLALRRARDLRVPVDGVILVLEPGRALGEHDVAALLDLPVVATVEVDPAVARSVDAGLLVRRLPRSFGRSLGSVT